MAKNRGNKESRQGRLRIVAGIWRSRLLQISDVPGLRPTSERIRETLFNWLGSDVRGAVCLDLFAGTGALGLEALSRGAARAVFVERSNAAVAALRENIRLLDASDAQVVHGDAREFLRGPQPQKYDLVFLDPPFAAELLDELCRLLCEQELLATGARVYLELGRSQPTPDLPDGWAVLKDKMAGNVRYMLVLPEGGDR